MTARAYVQPDLGALGNGVLIFLKDSGYDGHVYIAEFADIVMQEHDQATIADDPKPLRLSEDMARAVYEALAAHFGGGPDMTTLRRDYTNERIRVDRLIGLLGEQLARQAFNAPEESR
jgi:hypothetical protein